MKRYLSLLFLIASLAACSAAQAQFAPPVVVLGSGGLSVENASYRLDATVGQPATGLTVGGNYTVEIGFWFTVPPVGTAIESVDADALPTRFHLAQNYPNPFNPATTIRYALPQPGPVRLTVYDVHGRAVTTLVDRPQAAGFYAVQFEAGPLPSGLYFYRIEGPGHVETRAMLLVK